LFAQGRVWRALGLTPEAGRLARSPDAVHRRARRAFDRFAAGHGHDVALQRLVGAPRRAPSDPPTGVARRPRGPETKAEADPPAVGRHERPPQEHP
jgi:hypothetical protein